MKAHVEVSKHSSRFGTAATAVLFGALLLMLAGCGPRPVGTDMGNVPGTDMGNIPGTDMGTMPGTDMGTPGTDSGMMMGTCAPATGSACGNTASIVRGVVSVAPGTTPTSYTGTLFIALNHYRLGGGAGGGGDHATATVAGVDLSGGNTVEFAIDMCSTAEMWSETYCEYRLITILDTNGNQGFGAYLPDVGEAAAVRTIDIFSTGTSPCLNIQLDCTAGGSCVSFTDPGAC